MSISLPHPGSYARGLPLQRPGQTLLLLPPSSASSSASNSAKRSLGPVSEDDLSNQEQEQEPEQQPGKTKIPTPTPKSLYLILWYISLYI